MAGMKTLSKAPLWKGLSFFMILRNLIIVIAIISFISSGVQVYNETGSYELAFQETGGKIFNPLHDLGEHSNEISETGLYVQEGNFLESFWGFLKNIWDFIDPLMGFLFGYFLILRLVVRPFLKQTNSPFVINLFTIIIFMLINMLYIALFTDYGMMRPFEAIGDFFKYMKGAFL